jgi:predicted MFS family arabinose efflux permease
MRPVLALPAYRRLLVAYTFNELAWGVGIVALAVLVYRRTGTPVGAMGFFLCASFVPALLSPALVARLDQRPVRRVLPVMYALEALAFVALAWFAHRFVLAPLLAVTLLDGTIALAARALARATSVAVLTPRGLLREGNALTNAAFSVCFMAGPALGGVVVAAGGTVAALLANTGLFIAMALTLASTAGLPGAPPERSPSAGRLRAALAHARTDPVIGRLLSFQAAGLLFFTISIPVEVVFAERTLHAGPRGYGWLLSLWGAGAVAGSAIYARWRNLPARPLIALGAAAMGTGFGVMAAAPSLGVALIGAALGGVGNGIEVVSVRTAIQEQAEQIRMARIMSLSESVTEAVPGGGIIIGGAIAALASTRTALAVAGVGALLIAVVSTIVLRPVAAVGLSVSERRPAA